MGRKAEVRLVDPRQLHEGFHAKDPVDRKGVVIFQFQEAHQRLSNVLRHRRLILQENGIAKAAEADRLFDDGDEVGRLELANFHVRVSDHPE